MYDVFAKKKKKNFLTISLGFLHVKEEHILFLYLQSLCSLHLRVSNKEATKASGVMRNLSIWVKSLL